MAKKLMVKKTAKKNRSKTVQKVTQKGKIQKRKVKKVKAERKIKFDRISQVEKMVKNLFSVFSSARKKASKKNVIKRTDTNIDLKLSQRLDSAGYTDVAKDVAGLSEEKPGIFSRIFAGFASKSLSYKVGMAGGGLLSVIVIFGLVAFTFVWYRGTDIPVLRNFYDQNPPVLSMVKDGETEYGVGIDSQKFAVRADGDTAFRSLGIANKVIIQPRIAFAVNLSDSGKTLEILPETELQPDTEYMVTIRKGTMFIDGSSLGEDYAWVFRTEPVFAIVGITPRDGSDTAPVDTTIEVEFNYKNLDTEEFRKYFQITPSISGRFELHGKKMVFLPTTDLIGNSRYRVVIKKGFKNGNGDVIGEDHTSEFMVSSHDSADKYIDQPRLNWLESSPVLSVSQDPWVGISGSGITTSIEYTLYTTSDAGLVDLMKDYKWELFEKPDPRYLTKISEFSRSLEQSSFFEIDLSDYGIYFLEAYNSQYKRSIYKYIVYTPIGMVVSESQTSLKSWVFDMNQKQQIGGASIDFYDFGSSTSPVHTDSTNSNGFSEYETGDVDFIIANYLGNYAVAFSENQSSLWAWYGGAGPENWGWEISDSSYKAFIYTDKPVYRPGDEVRFKAVVRKDDDMLYSIPGEKTVTVRVGTGYYYWNDLQKLPFYEEDYELSGDFGTVTGSFELPSNTEIGYQTLRVLIDGAYIGYQDVIVAEYVKPRYTFDMSTDKTLAFDGDNILVDVWGTDYSGDPAVGQRLQLSIYKSEISANWFDGSDDLNWGNVEYSGGETIVDTTLTLNKDGYASYNISVDADDFSSNLGKYSVSVWSEENYNNYESEYVLVAESDLALFARSEKWSIQDGEDNNVDFKSVKLWDFDKEGGVKVDIDSVVRSWTEWVEDGDYYDPATKTTKPLYSPVEHVETVLEGEELTTDSDGEAVLELTNLQYGSYSINATYYDGDGISRVFSQLFYVYAPPDGDGYIYSDWASEYDKFRIYLDKEEYDVGETASISIKTTLEGKGVYMVQRGEVYDWKIVDFSDGMITLQQKITEDMAPIAAFCIWGVDEFTSSESFTEDLSSQYLSNVFVDRCSYVDVNREFGELDVEVISNKQIYEPGDHVILDIHVTDSAGKGVVSEVSVDVIDKALLDLVKTEDISYGIYDYFYDRVNQWANTYSSMYKYFLYGAGMGAGGGMGESTPRSNFEDIAYWDGIIRTNGAGKAKVEFDLPDNLTTWTARVVAVTEDTWVGESDAEFLSRKDVSLDAKLPRFLRSGDKWEMDLDMKNFSASRIAGKLSVTCDGCIETGYKRDVVLNAGTRTVQKLNIFPDDGVESLKITADLSSGNNTYDTVEWIVPVVPEGFMDSMSYSTLMTEGDRDATLVFDIPGDQLPGGTDLKISFARSFVNEWALVPVDPSIASSVELSGSIIHNSVFYKYYDEIRPSQDKDIYDEKIRLAVDMLLPNQSESGGFGWFDYDAVSYELSAYVGVALGRAVDSGAIEYKPGMDNLKKYLWMGLESDATSQDEKAFAIYSLAVMGDDSVLPYAIWFKNQDGEGGDGGGVGGGGVGGGGGDFSGSALNVIHLMLALQELGSYGDAGEMIPFLEDMADVFERGATWEDAESESRIVKSVDYTTAMAYLALFPYEQTGLGELARNWLVDNNVDIYGSSVDTVGIFYALTVGSIDNIEGRKGVNKVSVKVNDQDIKTFDVGGDEDWVGKVNLTIDAKYLKPGQNKVEIERSGEGDLYVVGGLTYYSPEPQGESEFAVKRSIRDFYSGKTVTSVRKGQIVTIRTEVKVERDAYNLVVHDFIPAGFEPVQYQLGSYDYQFISKWWKWGQGGYVNRYGIVAQDHITFSEYSVRDGKTYSFEFPAVAAFTGEFCGAGSQGYLLGFEDIGGISTSPVIKVRD